MRKLIFLITAVLMCAFGANSQLRTITGTVVDAADNEPLVGATVMPIGGGQGVAADIDGHFTLKVPAKVKSAKVSYVGYNPVTVELKDGMVVKLTTSGNNLSDVVVVAYGTATKESLTGSVAVVDSKEIERRPVGSVTSALEGNAPGVQVSSSTVAGPGGAPAILIRGINSVNGSNAPIYVLDGVIYDGSIADINPDDVESMSVLKDAASCALYGSQGANGVIMITTKKAKNAGKINVNLKISQGVYQRGLPFYDTMNSNEWMETMLTSMVNSQYSLKPTVALDEVRESVISNFFGNSNVWNIYNDEAQSAATIFDKDGKVILNPLPGYNDLNWWNILSQNGHRQEYNISLTAASEKYNVFASVGYLKANGYMIESDFERFNSRINLNANPVSYFKFGTNLSASYSNAEDVNSDPDNLTDTANPFNSIYRAPVFPYYNHDQATGNIIYDESGNPQWNTTSGYTPYENNIAYMTRANNNDYRSLQVIGSIYGTAVLPYGFEFTVKGDMNRSKETYMEFANPYIGAAAGSGRITYYDVETRTHTFSQQLTWSQEYGDHHVDAILSHESRSYNYGYHSQKVQNMVFWNGPLELTNFTTSESFGATRTQINRESYLGRVRWNYAQKYYGEASLRRDGTSRFAKNVRWGTFWSVGANWMISKEKFLQDVDWLTYLKVRGAYGTTGQEASAGAYAYWSVYNPRSNKVDNNLVIYPYTIANPDLKWESVQTLDLAAEGAVFDNRLNFTIGYFLKYNKDLIYNVNEPLSTGVTWSGDYYTIPKNVGTMQNWGWEIALGGDIIRTPDFVWHAQADASFIKNKLVKLPQDSNWASPRAMIEGYSRYEFYLPTYVGVDNATGRALYLLDPGSHEFMTETDGVWAFDQNKWDTNLNEAENEGMLVKIGDKYYSYSTTYSSKELHGTSLPTVFGSFGTSFSWKGINLNALFTYSLGGKLIDSTYSGLMSTGDSKTTNYHRDVFNSWVSAPAGFDVNNEQMMNDPSLRINTSVNPEINQQYDSYNTATSSRWLTSSDYLQFKNLSISYDFPKKLTAPLKLEGLNAGFTVENLFTVTARKGINPGYSYGGGQGNYFVVARTFSFQLSAKF